MCEWPPHSWGHQAWAPGGPSRVSVGADRGKDYSWVLAHALAGICRRLAKNDVDLVFEAILAVTAGAWAPFSLGPEQLPALALPLCLSPLQDAQHVELSSHWLPTDFTSGSKLPILPASH